MDKTHEAVLYWVRQEGGTMPEISLFCGIRITMFYSDHNPPHFHAEYGGYKALVDIQHSCVIRGAQPPVEIDSGMV